MFLNASQLAQMLVLSFLLHQLDVSLLFLFFREISGQYRVVVNINIQMLAFCIQGIFLDNKPGLLLSSVRGEQASLRT